VTTWDYTDAYTTKDECWKIAQVTTRHQLSPAGGLLQHWLLPSARRWSGGRLFLDLGAGRTGAAPSSAEPLRGTVMDGRRPVPRFWPAAMGIASPRGCRHAGLTDRLLALGGEAGGSRLQPPGAGQWEAGSTAPQVYWTLDHGS
jgi:hypothetical protein